MFNKVEVKNHRLYEKIIDEINRLIQSGELKPGDYLPPERELAEQFGVSRVPVREATKTLEFMGVLENTTKGLRVTDSLTRSLVGLELDLKDINSDTFSDLLEAREPIELKIVELACKNRTEDDLAAMDAVIAKMGQEVEKGMITPQTSREFHYSLTNACKNSVLTRILQLLDGLLGEVREQSLLAPGRYLQSYEESYRIIEAVRIGDAELACREMQLHMTVMRGHYEAYSSMEHTEE